MLDYSVDDPVKYAVWKICNYEEIDSHILSVQICKLSIGV